MFLHHDSFTKFSWILLGDNNNKMAKITFSLGTGLVVYLYQIISVYNQPITSFAAIKISAGCRLLFGHQKRFSRYRPKFREVLTL